MAKLLIINADDFGASPGINRGILRAHREGVLTSTSLMVRWPAAAAACAMSREFPALSVGLHVDLGEWMLRDGEWKALYDVVPLTDRVSVEEEVSRQLDTFRRLVGRDPTHLDSHQHVHLEEPVRSVVDEAARQLGIPLRRCRSEIQYCGSFYGQDPDGTTRPDLVSSAALVQILTDLPEGISELCCHPAEGEDLHTMYLMERPKELEALCHADVRAAIQRAGIELCSFQDVLFRNPALIRACGFEVPHG